MTMIWGGGLVPSSGTRTRMRTSRGDGWADALRATMRILSEGDTRDDGGDQPKGVQVERRAE